MPDAIIAFVLSLRRMPVRMGSFLRFNIAVTPASSKSRPAHVRWSEPNGTDHGHRFSRLGHGPQDRGLPRA